MPDNFERMRDACERAKDIPLSRLTVGELLEILRIEDAQTTYPLGEYEAKESARRLEFLIARSRTENGS